MPGLPASEGCPFPALLDPPGPTPRGLPTGPASRTPSQQPVPPRLPSGSNGHTPTPPVDQSTFGHTNMVPTPRAGWGAPPHVSPDPPLLHLPGHEGATPGRPGRMYPCPAGAQQDPLRETKPTFPTNGPSWGRDPRRLAPTHPTRCCGLKADVCHQSCRKPAPRTLGTSVVNPLIREPWAPAWVPCRSHSRVLSTNTMCCLGEVAQAPLRERQLKGGPAEPRDAERVPVGGVLFTH